jgi:hypothetical protein
VQGTMGESDRFNIRKTEYLSPLLRQLLSDFRKRSSAPKSI